MQGAKADGEGVAEKSVFLTNNQDRADRQYHR